jgi:hypothetical protein
MTATGREGPALAATGAHLDAHCVLQLRKQLHSMGSEGAGLVATGAPLDDHSLLQLRK